MKYDYINLYVKLLGYGLYDDTLTKRDVQRVEGKANKIIEKC